MMVITQTLLQQVQPVVEQVEKLYTEAFKKEDMLLAERDAYSRKWRRGAREDLVRLLATLKQGYYQRGEERSEKEIFQEILGLYCKKIGLEQAQENVTALEQAITALKQVK